ncbi:MAG TPA: hypothetical protein VLK83_01195 [Rhodanobacteraceae bacterium]|nr:hypothetical protein [Rhodanobacteraceae bacterium]
MILRRFTARFRSQDWMAVVIELVVVILGVFIGVQVSNWNTDLETDRKSALLTSRLKADLREEAWGYELQVGYYEQVLRNAVAAEDALAGRTALPDEALLVAAYRATQYNAYIRRRATYDELTSTGDIGLIRDTALRELAMHTYTAEVFNEVIDKARSSEFRIAFRKSIPRDVQTTLTERCGDHLVPIGDYAVIDQVLDYPCTTTLPAAAITSSVAIIRTDPNFAAALRLRIADLGTDLSNLTWFYKDDLRDRLRALAKEAP